MPVSTKKPAPGTNQGSAPSTAQAVQRSGEALGDPLSDPLQASTGIFGADAVQMDGVDMEDSSLGSQVPPDVCRVSTADTGAETGDQSGTMLDGSGPPAEEKKKIPKGF